MSSSVVRNILSASVVAAMVIIAEIGAVVGSTGSYSAGKETKYFISNAQGAALKNIYKTIFVVLHHNGV